MVFRSNDKKGELIIINDSVFSIYDNEIVDRAIGYISNKCSENVKELNKSNKNGRFLITHKYGDDNFMCFYIESLSSNKLILEYEGRTL